MKRLSTILTVMSVIMFTACNSVQNGNPFFEEYNTPFGVPPFDKIKIEHYQPALEEGISQALAEIDAIVANPEAPTFENTVEALEYSGQLLDKVYSVFGNAMEIDGTDQMNALAQVLSQKMSQYSSEVNMNPDLFARIKAVYDQKDNLELNAQQARLLEETYKGFVRGGALLSDEAKSRLKEINEELTTLNIQFENNVRSETNNFRLVIENEADLAGLSESYKQYVAEEAKNAGLEGKWLVTLDYPSIWPFLQMSENRELRKQVYTAYLTRANHNDSFDNKEIIKKQVALRAEMAQLFGFENFSAYTLDENMAKTPEAARNLLMQIWEPALRVAKQELSDIKVEMQKDGLNVEPEAWDWSYYSEKVRKARFDIDENTIRPYFELNNVVEGAFMVANKLYGLTFTRIDNIPLCHPEAISFEVKEADGSHVGILYMDFYPRPTKGQGAWMTEYRTQHIDRNGEYVHPIVSLVFNFTKPVGDAPALLSLDEAETVFHEFGHGLHGLISDNYYESLSGTNVSTDFVELPSQIMENWFSHPEVLKLYAKNYETGEVISDELIAKMDASSKFNQGFMTTELTAAALLDLDYHVLGVEDANIQDVDAFEKAALDKLGLISQIPPRYHSTYFKHIFGGGYQSRYYSYEWSETLDADAFDAFRENGLFDPATAKSFRENVLERGGSDDPMVLYKNFRGHEPSIEPLLRNRGLL